MNETDECDSLIDKVNWTDAVSLVVLAILLLINVMVVVGNCLVIAAVYISSKLRTVTNLFIVSLAVADLMVGVAVLPFSATWEVFKVWIFGDLWCSIWLAVDVWMCTASILNLCAISLDRYVAVTRPVNYPSIMSSSRAKILIAGVWILSFVICFPPLVGWKDSRPVNVSYDASGFRIRHSHPMVVNRPSATTTSREPEIATTITIAPSYNITEWLMVNGSHEYGSSDYDNIRTKYDDYPDPEDYDDFLWTKQNKRLKKFAGDTTPMKKVETSGVSTEAINTFRHSDREVREKNQVTESSKYFFTTPEPLTESFRCPWICELTSDTGYVIYSAFGSFFIPMGVMLFFYWKIYRAAVQTTRAINQGFRTTKGSGGFGNRFDEQRLTLRIHRGRGSVQNHSSTSTTITSCGSISGSSGMNNGHGKSAEVPSLSRTRSNRSGKSHEKIKISVSYPSSDQISASVLNNNGIPPPSPDASQTPNDSLLNTSLKNKDYLSIKTLRPSKKTIFLASSTKKNFFQNHFASKKYSGPKEVSYSVHYTNKNGKETTSTNLYRNRNPSCYLRVTGARLASSQNSKSDRSLSIDSMTSGYEDDSMSRRNSTRSGCAEDASKDLSPSPTFDDGSSQRPKLISKMGKRNIKTQVKRFRMETKAAKTLGIIVGGFILCWMPFFTIYLIRAFCPNCINPIVFSVLFWLGYCNSAINPCIYALFSKDFRFAFKKIICRFLCGPERRLSVSLKRRGSDGSQMTQKTMGRQRSPSFIPPNSMGDDSDPGGSDSR